MTAAPRRRFLLVGLTGNISTGKSTVSRMLAHLGCKIIDADQLAREVVMPGQPAHAAIVAEFGREVLQDDGYLDRKKLGALVFAQPERRRRLEAITHPAVRTRFQRILAVYEEEAFEGIVIWDVPLLMEGGGDKDMDRVVVVSSDEATQLDRLMARDGSTEPEARARMTSQMPLAEKARRAHHVIDNSGDRAATERQVRAVHAELMAELKRRLAAAPTAPA